MKCKCKEGEYYYEDICQECPSGTFIYKEEKTCVSECPLGYIVNVLSNECEVKPPPEPEDPPTPPEPEKPKEDYTEFVEDIKQNVVDLSKNQTLVQNSNTSALIYKDSDKDNASQISKDNNLSTIDLGECSNTLRTIYNLLISEDLIILKIDKNRTDSLTNEVAISLGVPFLICLVFASMRLIAFKYKNKTLYTLLGLLNSLI